MSTHMAREINRQPESWTRAIGLATDFADVLPHAGERVAVIGCGTSWFMADAYATLRELSGLGETDAFAASRFPARRSYDRVIALSRSGTTTEVLRAIEQTRAPVTAVTAVADTPLATTATDAVVLDFADEESVVQTVFATTALMLLRASLGEPLDEVVTQAREVLDGAHALSEDAAEAAQYTFVGEGWAYAIGLEAALKLRESVQLWTEAYPQLEYRHGPIAIAEPGRAVWMLGTAAPGLVGDVAATGAVLVDHPLDPVADLVRVHLLAGRRAAGAGLDPDHPRHLTRSVVLGESRT